MICFFVNKFASCLLKVSQHKRVWVFFLLLLLCIHLLHHCKYFNNLIQTNWIEASVCISHKHCGFVAKSIHNLFILSTHSVLLYLDPSAPVHCNDLYLYDKGFIRGHGQRDEFPFGSGSSQGFLFTSLSLPQSGI